MKDKLIKFINETIDKTTKARMTSNKIMADDCAGNLAYNLAYTYSNYVDEDDALSRMIKLRLNSAIQSFDMDDGTSECDYKEMWEELRKKIKDRQLATYLDSEEDARKRMYHTAYAWDIRNSEDSFILSEMKDIEEERFNK